MRRSTLALALLAGASLPTLAMAANVPALDAGAPLPPAQVDTPSDAKAGTMPNPYAGPTTQTAQTQADGRAYIDPASVPRTMPPAISPLSPDRKLKRNARVSVGIATRWREHFVKPTLGADGRLHFVWGSGEPTVVCAPMHWCDVALEPGEIASQPANLGDPRWLSHLSLSGTGAGRVTHILVKPSDTGLSTNLNLQTDRRSYSIELVSREAEYMPLVAFDYPETQRDTSAGWEQYSQQVAASGATMQAAGAGSAASGGEAGAVCDQAPSILPSSYHIGEGRFPWRPLQVYAVSTPVGIKTCVEFGSDIGSRNLPSLVALSNDGTWFSSPFAQMENLRFVGRRYVVDGEVDRFALIEGVGDGQNKIIITRRDAR